MASATPFSGEMRGKEMKAVPVLECALFENCLDEIRDYMDKTMGIYSHIYCDNVSEPWVSVNSLWLLGN